MDSDVADNPLFVWTVMLLSTLCVDSNATVNPVCVNSDVAVNPMFVWTMMLLSTLCLCGQ